MARHKPDFVIMQIGGNDLTDKKVHFTKVASDVHEIALSLVHKHGAKAVVVCQTLKQFPHRRANPKYRMTEGQSQEYVHRAKSFNHFVEVFCSADKPLMYWPHRELWTAPRDLFLDGVHLNWENAYKRYFRSVRGAIIALLVA